MGSTYKYQIVRCHFTIFTERKSNFRKKCKVSKYKMQMFFHKAMIFYYTTKKFKQWFPSSLYYKSTNYWQFWYRLCVQLLHQYIAILAPCFTYALNFNCNISDYYKHRSDVMNLTFNFKPSTSNPFGDAVRNEVRFPSEVLSDQCWAWLKGFPRTSKL